MAIKQISELEKILQTAADMEASDVHLVAGEPVTYRVHGELKRSEEDPMTAEQIKAVAAAAVGQSEIDRIGPEIADVRTSCGIPGVIDAKLTVARSMGDLSIVIRVMPRAIMTMHQCGVAPSFVEAAMHPRGGLVIVSGVMGSGKTTVAISLVNHMVNNRNCNVVTIEDPIATYLTPAKGLVHQCEVGVDVPNALAGIRSALRRDADVIMLSELTRIEEVDAAVTAASLGHTVIIVMNVGTAAYAIERLIDIHPQDTQAAFRKLLAKTFRAASAQWLFVRQDKPGRVAAYDVILVDENVREAIASGKDLKDVPRAEGAITLQEHMAKLRQEGMIDAESVERTLEQI